MLLEYEWGNTAAAAAAAAMLLFGEDSGPDQQQQLLDHHYVHSLGMDFYQHPQPISAAAASLFANPSPCHQRYGLALPPQLAPAARIGLNLGERTYFSLASPKEEMAARRVCRRRTRTARCQAEGCGSDLTNAKHYHRRHKVCEFHSKTSVVMAAGLAQRFCQQCSRFHVLSEFDQGKRSCRKRLAEHNRRRRKSHDLSTPAMATQKNDVIVNSLNVSKQQTLPNVTHLSTTTLLLPRSLPVPPMSLVLRDPAAPTVTVLSASSSTETSPTPSLLRFTGWNDGEDGSSIEGIYQNVK